MITEWKDIFVKLISKCLGTGTYKESLQLRNKKATQLEMEKTLNTHFSKEENKYMKDAYHH